jgi:bifunctional non-homologous end joining protein LigD
MPDALDRYRSMRDFEATPEPAGQLRPADEAALRFVVQEHHATALHWDLRLERDGVLVSWSVPKGIPADPRQNHLAVHTEDHPIEYLEFSGDIPRGNYGAGSMTIWDAGTYEAQKFEDREVMVTFHGRRIEGRYVLFQTDGRNWMIHRMDPPADPTREPLPSSLRPMTGGPGDLPGGAEDDQWAYEILWQGVRILVPSEGGRARLEAGPGEELGSKFPEIRAIGAALGTLEVVVDGVITAGDAAALDRRRHATSASATRRLAERHPAVLMVFDLLWLEGHATTGLAYAERRRLLGELGDAMGGAAWSVPSYHVGDGAALLSTASAQGLPGIVAKRLDGIYLAGQRSPDWRIVAASS